MKDAFAGVDEIRVERIVNTPVVEKRALLPIESEG
jgi:hypothetical protein